MNKILNFHKFKFKSIDKLKSPKLLIFKNL